MCFVFFKQKTAYEVRIIDWSSDVCSSDLISAFRYQPAAMRLPVGHELYGLLRMLGRFAIARREGKGLHIDQIQDMEPMLTDALVQQLLAQFSEIGLRSEEHTSELQSLMRISYAVFCLKKKKITNEI